MLSSEPDPESVWRQRGSELVATALDVPDLVSLIDFLPSVEPTLILAELEQRAADGDRRAIALLTCEVRTYPASPLPIAHPLDYDWRFTAETNDALTAAIAADSVAGEAIIYLGAPTTWETARLALPDRRHVLFDRNERHAGADGDGALHIVDLLTDSMPDLHAALAIVDPPWYPEHHIAFLAQAAHCLRLGGRILASFPTEMTRPGVLAERALIVQDVEDVGLSVVDEAPLYFRYATPPFERAAFSAAGVPAIPDAWRRGDLLTFDSANVRLKRRPLAIGESEEWAILAPRGIPVAVRANARATGTALLAPAIAGATLPSVSRRHPARNDAVLWSSLNRVYNSSHPETVAAIVKAFVAGTDPSEVGESAGFPGTQEEVKSAAKAILALVERERSEHGLL